MLPRALARRPNEWFAAALDGLGEAVQEHVRRRYGQPAANGARLKGERRGIKRHRMSLALTSVRRPGSRFSVFYAPFASQYHTSSLA